MLKTLYDQLLTQPSPHQFTAAQIPSMPDTYIAIDTVMRPVLFKRTSSRSADAPLRTAHISLRLGAPYTITTGSPEPVTGFFDCLSCEATDDAAKETFLVLVDAYLASAERGDSATAMSDFFRALVRLFAVPAARDLAAERQGLWGELFTMRSLNGYLFWAPSWHTEPNRRFDFSANGKRVEVKTTSGGPRIHHFAHRQVFAVANEQILIASLIVILDDVGVTLRHLIEECRQAIAGTPQFLSLERAVRKAGMDDPTEVGPAFDAASALASLAWFNSVDVPHFRVPEPPGVSDTRYRIDLSTAPRLSSDQLTTWLADWQALPASV